MNDCCNLKTVNTGHVTCPASCSPYFAAVFDPGSRTSGFNQNLAIGVNSWNSKNPSMPVSEIGGTYNETFINAVVSVHTTSLFLGFAWLDVVNHFAPLYPHNTFYIIDSIPSAPNAIGIIFKENEGTFLSGMIAASTSSHVGFIGGMPIPLIKKFLCGFVAGARYVRPDVKVYSQFVGTDVTAWGNISQANSIALNMYSQGVGVIQSAAGSGTMGIINASKHTGKYSMGVDIDAGSIDASVLSSMIKKVDSASEMAFSKQLTANTVLGLKEGGVSVTTYRLSDKIKNSVAAAESAIINGEIVVPDYTDGASGLQKCIDFGIDKPDTYDASLKIL